MKHEHSFVIPVEWTELMQNLTSRPYGYKVTKLRCRCGAEIVRPAITK
jgi:hypothetical protein